jgi:cellulose synthase/poly-beta-1,6-N-acetylglucosamine synthase-like glycosyltransferase
MIKELARKYLSETAREEIKRLLGKKNEVKGPSLNEKINAYINSNKNRQLPPREETFRPEIIVPCYKHGRFLEGLLKSSEAFGFPVTIVNDNSPDDTHLILERLASQFKFRYIRNEYNMNQAGSINSAISSSANNLFIILNADDLLMPYWPSYVVSEFQRSDIRMIGGGSIHFTSGSSGSELDVSSIVKSISYLPSSRLVVYGPKNAISFTHDNSINMTMSGCAFLKSAWEFIGGFATPENRVSRFDDRDFQMRLCCFFEVGITDEFSSFYRINSSTGRSTV